MLVTPVTFVQNKVGHDAYFTVFINDPDLGPTESESLLLFNNNLNNFVPVLEVIEGQNVGKCKTQTTIIFLSIYSAVMALNIAFFKTGQSLNGTGNQQLASAWPNNAQGSLKTVLHWNPQAGYFRIHFSSFNDLSFG
jgi:hypothetical protein